MTTKDICTSYDTIAVYSLGLWGIEIKAIVYGADDYIYSVEKTETHGDIYHKSKIKYDKDEPYFRIDDQRIRLNECLRIGGAA